MAVTEEKKLKRISPTGLCADKESKQDKCRTGVTF
jgi:hypothetical protein